MKNKDFIDVTTHMLVKNPLQRATKFAQIKNSTYFSDFNFENLLTFNITPPFFPEVDNNIDKNSKPITFAHYIKTNLTEFKLPSDFKPDKKQINDFSNWFKNF